jgi:hypothetical protein
LSRHYILEGALRVMPAWEINFLGHTLSLSVLIPFVLPLGIILGGAAIWPFFERWVTGDRAAHHINDRPRNVPTRTGIGVAVVVFYGVLWAEGANDVIADQFHVPLYTVTWIARVLVIVGPVAVYVITRRICLALQRKDAETLEHGVERGHHPPVARRRVHRGSPARHRRGASGAFGQARDTRPAHRGCQRGTHEDGGRHHGQAPRRSERRVHGVRGRRGRGGRALSIRTTSRCPRSCQGHGPGTGSSSSSTELACFSPPAAAVRP